MNELKSRFVSMASHEFWTPLSIVLSSTSLIGQHGISGKDERIQKYIARIKSSVGNLANILNDFLSLDKLGHVNAHDGEDSVAVDEKKLRYRLFPLDLVLRQLVIG